MNLVEKYRAKKYEDFVGQAEAIQIIEEFIKTFPKKKALLIHGPPGTGKTALVFAAAKSHNLEILELNASDLRNREALEIRLRPATSQQSLFKKGKIILMDEVDGVTGTDRGGIPELVKLIHSTQFPIIMTCNDVWQSKLSPVRAKSRMIEMKKLSIGEIVSILSRICANEALDKEIQFLKQIAIKSQGDMRAAINDLESYSHRNDFTIDLDEKRNIEENIFNILKQLFKERKDFLDLFDNSSLSIDEILLWVEENIPKEYKNEQLAKAYYSLGQADVFRGRIYRNQSWRFLVYQNIFQSAGISYAKSGPGEGFTKYERPKRVLKIWLHNQKMLKKKTIAKKFARYAHCSTRRAMRDFDLLAPVIKQPSVQKALKLSEEESSFLDEIESNLIQN